MITLVFASPPAVTAVDARGMLLPCSTDDWAATGTTNATTWAPPTTLFYEDATIALRSRKPVRCNAFGLRILATSAFLEIWQAQHGYSPWLPENWQERHYTILTTLSEAIDTLRNVNSH